VTTYYRTDTGAPVDVGEADAPTLLLKGAISLPTGTPIHLDTEDGPVSLPIEQAWGHLAKPGVSIVSPEEVERRALQEKYGGAGQQILTSVEQGLGGATLGAAPAIEGAVLGNSADIVGRAHANPINAGVSNVVGAILPTVLAPETGAGEAEEAGALAGLAKAVGAPSRGLARAGGAVEDFMMGALNASESDSVVSALAKQVAAKGVAGAAEGAAVGAAQHVSEEAIGDPDANGESLYAAMGHGALLGFGLGGALGAGGELGSRALGRLSPHMTALAEEQAARAVGLEGRALGRRLLDDEAIHLGDDPAKMLPRVEKASMAADQRVRALLEVADQAGHEAPDVESLLKVAGKNEHAVRAVEQVADIPSVEEAAAQGLDRDAMMFSAKVPLTAVNDLNHAPAMRGMFQPVLDEAAGRSARKMGGSFLDEYKDARLAQSQYAEILPALAKRVARATEQGIGLPGLGMLMGGPVGAAKGLALGMAKRALAERGAGTAAVLLEKLAALRAVERAKQIADRQIARGVSGMLGTGKLADVRIRLPVSASYEERVAAVQRMVADPKAGAALAVGDIEAHAPKAAQAFQATSVRIANYLAGLIPKQTRPPSITPQFDRPHLATAQQRATFNRAFDVAHDPDLVLHAAGQGRLTRDHVKALAAEYPARYAAVVTQTHEQLAALKRPLSPQRKATAMTLLGMTTDPVLARQFQETYANLAPPPPSGPQQKQHANKGPHRAITAPARITALDAGEGRPLGSSA
jgi:hypothetical protein